MKLMVSLFLLVACAVSAFALPLDSLWSRTYGSGTRTENGGAICRTVDGGYAIAGFRDDAMLHQEFYLLKVSAVGDSLWSKSYDGGDHAMCFDVIQTADGGFAMVGQRRVTPSDSLDGWLIKTNATGDTLWTRTFGGAGSDWFNALTQTADGGYLLGGIWNSGGGAARFYVVKVDQNGGLQWTRQYGATLDGSIEDLLQDSDGGYLLAGAMLGSGGQDFCLFKVDANGDSLWRKFYGTESNEYCVSVCRRDEGGFALGGYGWTGSLGSGDFDVMLVLVDSLGNQQALRYYGAAQGDRCNSVQPLAEGGVALAGQIASTSAPYYTDFWLLKIDANADTLWSRRFGGSNSEICYDFLQANDRGLILTGSLGGDIWLVKTGPEIPPPPTYPAPDSLWSRTYGSSDSDWCRAAVQTWDGGYLLGGGTAAAGGWEMYVVKATVNGSVQWSRTFGSSGNDNALSVATTTDSGYVIAGARDIFGVDGQAELIRLDSNGDTLWTQQYGGTGSEGAFSVQQTNDGGFVLAGWTTSYGAGSNDMFLVKTDPAGNQQWQRTFGGGSFDRAETVRQTADGGYLLVGSANESGGNGGDVYAVKTDTSGNLQWSRVYDKGGYEKVSSAVQCSDGGYLLAGRTNSIGAGSLDVFILRLNSNGDTLWTRAIGGAWDDAAISVALAYDDGFVVGGWTKPLQSAWPDLNILRLNNAGELIWTQSFGGAGDDEAFTVIHLDDGGVAACGYTNSLGAGLADMWLVRTAPERSLNACYWADTLGGSWFDWNNWDPARVPEATDTVFIILPGDYTVTVPADAQVSQLILGSEVPGDTTHQTLDLNCANCQFSIYGNSVVRASSVLSAGNAATIALMSPGITLTDSGQVTLSQAATLDIGTGNALALPGGLLDLAGNSDVVGGTVLNAGRVTRQGAGTSTLSGNYRDTGAPGDTVLHLTGGVLSINAPDSAAFHGIAEVAAGAELSVQRAQFGSDAAIEGAGTLSLTSGNALVAGDFALWGMLRATGGTISFQPSTAVSLDTFRIETPATFVSTVALNTAVVQLRGGATTADFNISNLCDWTAGTLSGGVNSQLLINTGVSLSLTGPGAKTLGTRDLLIEGSASMSGAGVFSLADGADIRVNAGGTLALGDSLTISGGADTLWNRGAMTISAPTDTCVLDLFLLNDPSGRTPGTIDVLSGRCRGERIRNLGSYVVHQLAEVWITGTFTNGSTVDLSAGSLWIATDSLINLSTGVIQLTGDAAITGAGVIENLGHIFRLGGGLRTPSTCEIGIEFHNREGGFVQIEADTLALTNPVADNADTIFIYTDAALDHMTTFTNLPGGVIVGGGAINVTINNVVAKIQSHDVRLSWTAIPGAVVYYIYRSTDIDNIVTPGNVVGIAFSNNFVHVDGALLPRAFYRVVPQDHFPLKQRPRGQSR